MKTALMTTTILGVAAATAFSQISLSTGEVDIGIAYEDGAWDLHVHDESTDTEYEPDEVILTALAAAKTTVPAGAEFAFLGEAGSPLWVLPQIEQAGVLYLGLGSEEIVDGTFDGDEYSLALVSVEGPGDFFLYSVDGLGAVTVLFDSADGIDGSDLLTRPTGGHEHFNWAFTAPGTYEVTVEASALLPDLTATSGQATYTFEVLEAGAPVPPVVVVPNSRPEVGISGKKRIRTEGRRVRIRGTADATAGVGRVMVKVGKARFRAARGTDRWSYVARLERDRRRTVVVVRAEDSTGATSARERVVIVQR